MKILVFIALAACLGNIPVQAYGPRRQYNNHGWSHGPPHTSPEAFHPSSFNDPSYGLYHGYNPSHGYSHKHFRPSHDFFYYDAPYFGPPSGQEDSTEWNSGSGSWEGKEDSSEFSGPLNDWHDRRVCKGPCKRPIKKPSRTTTTPLPTTTRTKRPRPTQATVPPHSENRVSNKPTDSTTRRSSTTVKSTETTSTPIETTTTTPEEITTESPQILACIESCITTPDYNPVCGTDGETYINEGRLLCVKGCGIDVNLRRRTVCPPPPFFGEDNERPPPTPPPTTITSPNFIARTTLFSGLQRCMKQCAIAPNISPVCGTNFVTYFNIERLKCAQECGEDVQVLCERPCAACGVAPVTVTTRTAPSTLVPGPYARSTVKPETKECLDSCPITSENNPVCGTDHVTYRNPSHLLCAQICGIGVTVARFSACPSVTPPITSEYPTKTESPNRLTSPEFRTTTESQTFLNCLRRCPVTSEFNPVCGTDDLNYSNPGYLECAKLCGLDVELKQKSPCDFDFEDEPTTLQTNLDEKREPSLTGSQSTATATSLFTSPTTIPTTDPVSSRLTTTSAIPTTTTATISTTRRTSGSTILSDILNKIFGSVTTKPPTTVPNPDDDEDVDLDARFGNDTTNDSDTSRIIFPE